MVAHSSFTLGGKRAEELGLLYLKRETEKLLLPGTRDKTVSVPGRHGVYDFGADLDARTFTLVCAIVAKTSAELEAVARILSGHLLYSNGSPKLLSLVFDEEPDREYFVRYSGSTAIRRIIMSGKLTLPLLAADPHAYGAEQEVEQVVEGSPENIEVQSDGNTETPPFIVLKNEGLNTINGFVIRYYEEIEE